MPTLPEQPPWRVQRVSGLLVPGFSKRFDAGEPASATHGCTYFLGVPIGRFDVAAGRETIALRYRRWPVVDVLLAEPEPEPEPPSGRVPQRRIGATGNVRLPGGRSWRFCSFELESP